jgi:integrase
LILKDIKGDNIIKGWLSGIGAKPNTKAIYMDDFRAYTEFLDKTPNELLTEAEAEIKAGLLMRERRMTGYLREFREYLEESGAAPMSIKGRLTGVRSFYKYYNIDLPVLPRSSTAARPQLKHRNIPNKDDIREVLAIADQLEKAIVLTSVSSGLAVNEIANLRLETFHSGYDPVTGITMLHLVREKVSYEFYTFLSPEATNAVLEYLKYRNHTSDVKDPLRQEHLLKQKVTYIKDKDGKDVPTGYLFIGRYISSDYLKLKDSKKPKERGQAEELRKLSTKAIQKIYRELSERARKASPSGEWNLMRSHNIRKFFNSTLLANGAPMFFVDYWMGHQIDATHDAYFRADPEKLKEQYQKYTAYLTIEKSLDVSVAPEYQNIVKENDILRAQAAMATVERHELEKIKASVEDLYSQIWDTPEGFELGVNVIRKLHPHRIILQPSPKTEAEKAQAEKELIEDMKKEYAEKGYVEE